MLITYLEDEQDMEEGEETEDYDINIVEESSFIMLYIYI